MICPYCKLMMDFTIYHECPGCGYIVGEIELEEK